MSTQGAGWRTDIPTTRMLERLYCGAGPRPAAASQAAALHRLRFAAMRGRTSKSARVLQDPPVDPMIGFLIDTNLNHGARKTWEDGRRLMTTVVHDQTMVTQDTRDFERTGAAPINSWEAS